MSEGARLVVDSSVVVKWFVSDGEAGVEQALALREAHARGSVVLAAPAHLVLEVLNALRSRGADAAGLVTAARFLEEARLELTPVQDLARRAAVIASERDLTIYDAAFAALAESLDSELVTADRRLAACGACRARLLPG